MGLFEILKNIDKDLASDTMAKLLKNVMRSDSKKKARSLGEDKHHICPSMLERERNYSWLQLFYLPPRRDYTRARRSTGKVIITGTGISRGIAKRST